MSGTWITLIVIASSILYMLGGAGSFLFLYTRSVVVRKLNSHSDILALVIISAILWPVAIPIWSAVLGCFALQALGDHINDRRSEKERERKRKREEEEERTRKLLERSL